MATAAARRTAPAAPTRTVAVQVPQWPLMAALDRHQRRAEAEAAAAGAEEPPVPVDPLQDPALLLENHRVVEATAAARGTGVRIGQTRRAARAACPEALVLEGDRESESALFELVAAAVDTVAAGVDVLRPGTLLMSARGPARHHGGEEALAERILDAVADHTGWEAAVGVADGPFAALLAASREPAAPFTIVGVLADKPAAGLDIAREAGIPTEVVALRDFPDRQAWDRALAAAVTAYSPDLVVLAGFMKLVGAPLLEAFGGRIINTHPALLPSFPGAHGVRDALAHGVKVTGATVIEVDAGVDTGRILAQVAVPVLEDDTEAALHQRIKDAEQPLLVQVVRTLTAR